MTEDTDGKDETNPRGSHADETSVPSPERLERTVLMGLLLAPVFWLGLWHTGDIVDTITGLRRIRPHETIAIAFWVTRGTIFGAALWLLHHDRSGAGGFLYLTAIGYPTIVDMMPGKFTGIVVPALMIFFGGLWSGAYVCWRKLVEGFERRGKRWGATAKYGLLGLLLLATTAIGVGSYSLVRSQMVEVTCDDRRVGTSGPTLGCSRTSVVDELPLD